MREEDLTRECLDKAGVPNARYKVLQHPREDLVAAAEAFGFPFVVKPIAGNFSKLVSIIEDVADFQVYLKTVAERQERIPPVLRPKVGNYVIEEYLKGLIISVEIGVCADGSIVRFMLSEGRRSAIDPTQPTGTQMPARTTPEEAEAAWLYSEQLIRALGFNVGLAHIEMVLTKAGWRMIEFNPRLMGWLNTAALRVGHRCSDLGRMGVPLLRRYHQAAATSDQTAFRFPYPRHFCGRDRQPRILGPDWMAPIQKDIVAHRLFVKPGERAYPHRSSPDSMGYVHVVAPTSDELRAKGDRMYLLDRKPDGHSTCILNSTCGNKGRLA